MISGALAGIIIAMSFLELFGQIFIKTYYETRMVYWFFIGWLFYAGVLYLLYRAYFYTGLAIANGLWSAATIIMTTLVGVFYYKEDLNFYEYFGIVLVIIGILLLGIFGNEEQEELE